MSTHLFDAFVADVRRRLPQFPVGVLERLSAGGSESYRLLLQDPRARGPVTQVARDHGFTVVRTGLMAAELEHPDCAPTGISEIDADAREVCLLVARTLLILGPHAADLGPDAFGDVIDDLAAAVPWGEPPVGSRAEELLAVLISDRFGFGPTVPALHTHAYAEMLECVDLLDVVHAELALEAAEDR